MDKAAADTIAQAPLPTPETLKARNSLLVQGYRFAAINVRMLKMVMKGHH